MGRVRHVEETASIDPRVYPALVGRDMLFVECILACCENSDERYCDEEMGEHD